MEIYVVVVCVPANLMNDSSCFGVKLSQKGIVSQWRGSDLVCVCWQIGVETLEGQNGQNGVNEREMDRINRQSEITDLKSNINKQQVKVR
jgi:hypothetical protein